jgi:pyruvate/2-oxoglutarate dehydrogenase complex dihydrolipoamide acyltransferase (E2) component
MARTDFLLPDLGEGLEEATVSAWLVTAGDRVELNQPIVEIETAKATVEIPSPHEGVIAKLHALQGNVVRVGDPIVTFELEGVDALSIAPAVAVSAPRVSASPAARRRAKELGVDLAGVEGTGPDGRISVADVEEASELGPHVVGSPEPPRASEPFDPGAEGPGIRAVTVSGGTESDAVPIPARRREIAERVTRTVRGVPMVTTWRTLDCTELDAFRSDAGVGPLPVVVRALAEVCAEHRDLNASYREQLDEIWYHRQVNVGIATDTEAGLAVPVLWNARARGVAETAAEIERLADAARTGTLKPEEIVSGTITISNTGSYGSEAGTPLLYDVQAAILALGVIAERPLVVDGTVQARRACTLSLTFDHRMMDGATAGRAFGELVELLSDADRLRELPA